MPWLNETNLRAADDGYVNSWSKQMNYKGSCHCGEISFEVEGTLEK
jgi:hypothetical protein